MIILQSSVPQIVIFLACWGAAEFFNVLKDAVNLKRLKNTGLHSCSQPFLGTKTIWKYPNLPLNNNQRHPYQ